MRYVIWTIVYVIITICVAVYIYAVIGLIADVLIDNATDIDDIETKDFYTVSLWHAIVSEESSGNPNAVGDGGKAIGIAQIHECVIDDVNKILGSFGLYVILPDDSVHIISKFDYSDRLDPVKSRLIFIIYTNYWWEKHKDKCGIDETQAKARIWNGGPRGWEKESTKVYWEKVKRQLLLNDRR